MKKRMKKYYIIDHRRAWIAMICAVCLIAAGGYALLHWAGLPKSERTLPREAGHQSGVTRADKMKPYVIQWMKNNSTMPVQILSLIYDEAMDHFHPDLILAICVVESNFNPAVESEKGAVGLMGIVPSVWQNELKRQGIIRDKNDLYLIPHNIASGVYVLRKYVTKSKNLEQALADYVGGDFGYVDKVLRALEEIYVIKMLNAHGVERGRTEAGLSVGPPAT